jgi:uncharacterized protein
LKRPRFRYLQKCVEEDLKKKLVFLGGPRQVGKTTLARSILNEYNLKVEDAYRNWDISEHRKLLLNDEIPSEPKLVVLDEIHKFAKWRTLVKGFYDAFSPKRSMLVTGSAQLDYFRKGGDSLLGRYHYFRLHPFTFPELSNHPQFKKLKPNEVLELLLKFGGFPEPLFSNDERTLRRWQNERNERIVNDDLRSLSRIVETSKIELLMEALPGRVGSPLSLQSLQEDLEVSHDSVKRWLEILERLYFSFRISPFGSPKIRAVKKEQKLYLWDWSTIENKGAQFENMVACHLLKFVHYQQDYNGFKYELRYLRDTDKREVDFVVLKNKIPQFAVEVKLGEKELSPHIKYFSQRTKIPMFFQTHLGNAHYGNSNVEGEVIPFHKLCDKLDLM